MRTPDSRSLAGATPLLARARAALGPGGAAEELPAALTRVADQRARDLVDGFVHSAGPAPAPFTWLVLGSHARGELHCASDQDHALVWATPRAARSSYAEDLAAAVISGLAESGLRPCDGGYMADRWSYAVADWVDLLHERIAAPTPEAVVDADILLDLRVLTGTQDVTPLLEVLGTGAGSARLMHGLARAALSFAPPRAPFGRLPRGPLDVKRGVLAPVVLLARLYGLRAGTAAVSTTDRLVAAAAAGVLGEELCARLDQAFTMTSGLRIRAQLAALDTGGRVDDLIDPGALGDDEVDGLRAAVRAVRAAQSVTAVTFRTDL